MSSLTGNKKAAIIAVLAVGFAVASLAITTPLASAQNATTPGGNMTAPGGNMTGGNITKTAFEGSNAYQLPPAPGPAPAPAPAPGGNVTAPGGNMTGGNQTTPGVPPAPGK